MFEIVEMPLRKSRYSLADVIDLVDGSDSEVEGFESESDGQFSLYCSDQSSESDNTGNTEDDDSNNVPDECDIGAHQTAHQDSEWDSDDELPLSLIARLTSPENFKWRNIKFQPPDDVEFHGNTKLPDLPTNKGEVTLYSLCKMFITDKMLESMVDEKKLVQC